jgi:hypothetical protein
MSKISAISLITSMPSAVTNGITGIMPKATVNSERANKAIAWVGQKISSPENRLILGVSALMSQPFIDLKNKHVDEDTRKVSAARTVAKIIAGTLTGVIIRYGCIKAINSFSKAPVAEVINSKFPRLQTLFTPSIAFEDVTTNLKKYRESYGTLLALVVMTFTNFLIDAPLTKHLTNKFVDKIHKNDELKAQAANSSKEKGVNNVA